MRWVSWAAVSSLPQAKKVSLDEQLAENRRHVEQHDGQVVAELVVPGESRSIVLFEDACRRIDAYEQLRRLIDAKSFDVLVYLDRSRLGRKASLSMSVVELCHAAGIATYETENPPATVGISGTHDDALIGAIKSVGAQREIDKMRERNRMGMADRVRRGHMASRMPYGYLRRYDAEGNATIIVDDGKAAIVRRIIAQYLGGAGTVTIADSLNAAGVAAPEGSTWLRNAVRYILRNVWTYAGYVELNRRGSRQYMRHPGNHQAIIDDGTAEQVDAERIQRTANRRIADTPFLLTGIAYCAECGQPMHCVNETTRHGDKTYRSISLRCPRHKPARYASYRRALRQLRAAIVALDTLDIDELIADDGGTGDMLQSQMAEQQATIERAQTALQRTDDAFFDGLMDDDRYRRQVARLRAQVDAAAAEIERLSTKYDAEADRAKRRKRINNVSAVGLAMLDGDATTGNAWLRQHVRLWVESGRVTDVEWL